MKWLILDESVWLDVKCECGHKDCPEKICGTCSGTGYILMKYTMDDCDEKKCPECNLGDSEDDTENYKENITN